MIGWILSAIGLISINIVIWVGGGVVLDGETDPILSVTTRIISTVIVLLLWAIIILVKKLLDKNANNGLIEELSQAQLSAQADAEAAAEQRAATEEELSGINSNFQEALDLLKKTKLKGRAGQQHLYDLPWYIIIGPPGSGKTTAISNSGLRFPLAERFGPKALRGVGGTRDCDWWFTDEAVLLDTAGRYTTQDSDAGRDSSGWDGFLGMLKRYRKRRPINGVFVALSVSDLIHNNESERAAHANAIKQRIQELREKLGVNPPVYMLFTKCDLISGFTEYFDDLGREDREQVWGLTFSMQSQDKLSREQLSSAFSAEFSALLARLNSRLISRLTQERDMQRRSLIHAFPHQLSAIKDNADRFLQEVFGPNRYQESFLLRGVYFTSGTQEGTPIDRMMGSLAANFGLDREAAPMFSGQGRSYFLTGLFQDLVFEESDIVGSNKKLEFQANLLRRGSYAAGLTLATVVTVAWAISYAGNASYIAAAQTKLVQFEEEKKLLNRRSKMQDTILTLNAVRDAANIYAVSNVDRYTGLGLSKQSSFSENGAAGYQAALQQILVPTIIRRLEKQLESSSDNAEFLMDALRAYLMMGQPNKRNNEFLKSWFTSDIQSRLAGRTETLQHLGGHIDTLFDKPFPVQVVSDTVIGTARDQLNSFPLATLIYTRLKDEAEDEGLDKFNLIKIIGASAEDLFDLDNLNGKKQITGLYTVDGFKEYYLKSGLDLAKEFTAQNWVLGPIKNRRNAVKPETLNREVGELLEKEFVDNWQFLLAGIHIVEFRNLRHGVDVMRQLSGVTSPLKKLLGAVSNETTLIDPPVKAGKGPKIKVKNKLFKKAARLAKKAKKLRKKKGGKVAAEPGEYVQAVFLPLNKIGTGSDGAKIDELLSLLAEVYVFLEEIASVSDGKAAFIAAQDIMTGKQDLLARLKIKAARYPSPLKHWIKEISDNSWRVVLDNARRHVNLTWNELVVPDFNRVIKNRYPVFKTTSREINMAEFSNFFGPDGIMDVFYNSYMKSFMVSSGRNWRLKSVEGRSLGLGRSSIATFQNANRIKQMFFGAGQLTPSVNFSLKPVNLDAAVTRFRLDLDGQRIDYRHGPTRNKKLQWPGPDGSNRTRLTFETTRNGDLVDTKDGAWAFYRILDTARVTTGSQRNQLNVTFMKKIKKKRYRARFKLTTESGINPFRRRELSKFRVTERL